MFTVCHKDLGYITHSYVIAKSLGEAKVKAYIQFQTLISVMEG